MDFAWRIAYKLYHSGKHPKLARFFEVISFMISSHAVSAQITIGANSRFYHHGLGCTALQTVHIGNNCIIFQNVTFGNAIKDVSGKLSDNSGGHCSVGDNVMIGAGAVILGNVRIGNNVSVGANAVVTHDIPNDCVAVGIPARWHKK